MPYLSQMTTAILEWLGVRNGRSLETMIEGHGTIDPNG